METFAVERFTVVSSLLVIARLAMTAETNRRRRSLIKIRTGRRVLIGNGFEFRGVNILSGAEVIGYLEKNGPSWVGYF